jgi:uncharacterized membrane protein YdjX (TVP38/TMEM64 family)
VFFDTRLLVRNLRIFLVLFVICVLLAAYQLGILAHISDSDQLKKTLVELGAWGYLAFVVPYALLQPFGLPGAVFIWSAPFVWPWYTAFLLSLIGTQAASVVGFSFARFIGREWVEDKIPARFKQYDESLAKRAFLTTFLLRLIIWMHPLLHTFFGLSAVSFSVHFWGSLLGYIPPMLLVSYFGPSILEIVFSLPWWVLLVVALVATLSWWIFYKRKRQGTGEEG